MKPEYEKGMGPGNWNTTTMRLGGSMITVKSGDLACSKCGLKLPPKEMFCADCFGEIPKPMARLKNLKPDEESLLDGIPKLSGL